jgi:AhpD family alkylhydroperoxidase
MTRQKLHSFNKRIYTPRALLATFQWMVVESDEFRSAMHSDRVSKVFSERIMLAVTAVNGCRYCSYAHTRMALQNGLSMDEVQRLLEGEIGHVTPEEAPALFFAQHYAENGGRPAADALQQLKDVYGPDMAGEILTHIRMITMGNLSGNTFDALFSRLRGAPAEGSTLWSELLVLLILAVGTPIVALAILTKRGLQAVHLVKRQSLA